MQHAAQAPRSVSQLSSRCHVLRPRLPVITKVDRAAEGLFHQIDALPPRVPHLDHGSFLTDQLDRDVALVPLDTQICDQARTTPLEEFSDAQHTGQLTQPLHGDGGVVKEGVEAVQFGSATAVVATH